MGDAQPKQPSAPKQPKKNGKGGGRGGKTGKSPRAGGAGLPSADVANSMPTAAMYMAAPCVKPVLTKPRGFLVQRLSYAIPSTSYKEATCT